MSGSVPRVEDAEPRRTDHEAERRLWCSAVALAFADLRGDATGAYDRSDRRWLSWQEDAEEWIFDPASGFDLVCAWLDLDVDVLREQAWRIIVERWIGAPGEAPHVYVSMRTMEEVRP